MKIVIDIPQIFEIDIFSSNRGNNTGFVDFFERVMVDIKDKKGLCGQYEFEICQMFAEQFRKIETLGDKL